MLNKINNTVKKIQVPGIRVFANQVVQYKDGINFTIGEPDFSTPESVKRAGIEAIKSNLTGYSHNAGLVELRKSVSDFFRDKYNFYYHPEDEVVITNGASEGIDSLLRTILSVGDEVILPAPIYSGYEPSIELSGAKVVYLDTTETNFIPDPEQLERLINEKTKAVIFNYPSNPTGMTLSKEQMDSIVAVLSKHDIFVISDEIYSENTFESEHISFASYPELRNKLFLVHGVSKSHAMTGWRIGFVLGQDELMKQVLKVHLNNSICASLPSQFAAMEALTNSRVTPEIMNEAYMERRDYVYDRLVGMGFTMSKPSGAFYMFPSIHFLGLTSFDFATQLLEQEHVAVVPGSAFTTHGEGYVRISYANSMENIVEGMNRIERFITK
ncbi:aminotransferase class I/II-fold pyridoxal phosphate-dependent enzyme [Pseudogracilibacillus sp. SE30717A]|uniref:aminotransferase class I/II-fold pyridoxal phosphate-dependent enzyme n=1 Tax=Pseudogracilibacillus sp. SE30717A TaxID=3098293 RepID=UPI00300E487F